MMTLSITLTFVYIIHADDDSCLLHHPDLEETPLIPLEEPTEEGELVQENDHSYTSAAEDYLGIFSLGLHCSLALHACVTVGGMERDQKSDPLKYQISDITPLKNQISEI